MGLDKTYDYSTTVVVQRFLTMTNPQLYEPVICVEDTDDSTNRLEFQVKTEAMDDK